jgi:hypothetical protein
MQAARGQARPEQRRDREEDMTGLRAAGIVGFVVGSLAASGGAASAENGYPTAARVDYVLGCMAANGQDYLTMQRCSCSIDHIAEEVSFEAYERVETIMRMREARGELALLFRTSPSIDEEVQTFRQAQVEADLRCF